MTMTTTEVMIYSPCPVLTVTIERDREAPELHLHAGGQGVWQARMLANLGVRGILCTTVGGEVGRVISSLLAAESFEVHAVPTANSSGWYVHDRSEGMRHEVAGHHGGPLNRHEMDELANVALAEGLRTGVSILGGPTDPGMVPPSTYRRLAADLRANGVRVVADLAGAHLSAAVAGGVDFLKVSHEELLAAGRASSAAIPALLAGARQLKAEGVGAVVISRAADPAVAIIDGDEFLVYSPRLEQADPRGAGDSMTAAVAAKLAEGEGLAEAVRIGAAAGAANVTRHGLGTARASAVAELAKRVRLVPVSEADVDDKGQHANGSTGSSGGPKAWAGSEFRAPGRGGWE